MEGRGCAAPPFSGEASDNFFGDLVPGLWDLKSCVESFSLILKAHF